jgi:hypothetical protein
MKIRKNIVAISASILSLTAFATPVEFDTPDAHVIVIRALDSWSGDKGASEDSLERIAAHKCAFMLKTPKGEILGHPLLFQGLSDNPIVQNVNNEIHKHGFELVNRIEMRINIDMPATTAPADFKHFSDAQREIFKRLVITQGNPSKRESQVSSNKFFGAVLALGTVAVGGEKYGSLGSQTVLNTGVASDVYELTATSKAAISPVELPNFDASAYKTIDVRKVTQNDRFGQVIIAYKNDKTDETENAALIKAIVTLTGADTTVDAIKQARNEDLTNRQAIWDECVAEGKCKKD